MWAIVTILVLVFLTNTNGFEASVGGADGLDTCLLEIVPSLLLDHDTRTWADRAGTMTNPRVVVYPRDADELAGVLTCVHAVNGTYRAVSGRHFYQRLDDVMVMIDVQKMCNAEDIVVDAELGLMTVPAGCPIGLVLASLPDAWLLPVGNCPSVGLGGFLLGGGMSDVSRYAGMGCDALQSLTLVTVDAASGMGVVRTASDPETLYTACGGGVGPESQLDGVVTAMTLKLTPSPTETYSRITVLVSSEATPEAILALQDMLRSDDARYFKLGGGGVIGVLREFDIGLVLNLLYLGTGDEGLGLLQEAGVVNDTWSSAMVDEFGSFRDAMAISMVQEGIGTNMSVACARFGCDQFTGLLLPESAPEITAMLREDGSPLLDKESDLWQTRQFSYPVPGFMLRGLDRGVWQQVTEVAMNPMVGSDGQPLCERHYALIAHLTGGQVSARNASETAYPWREETLLLTWLNGMDPEETDACQVEAARYQAALVDVPLHVAYANYRGSDAYNVTYLS